jgi:hypothetical protein
MIKVKQLKKDNLVGKTIPTNKNGHAGRAVENLLEDQGYSINRRGAVPDMEKLNLEVKTRDLDATSPQTVGTMLLDAIKVTPYRLSSIAEKLKQQLRVKTKDRVIVESRVWDFSDPYIQSLIETSYETARQKIIAGCRDKYIPGGEYGYFEKCTNSDESYAWRMSQSMMDKLETMSNNSPTFNKIFEVIE